MGMRYRAQIGHVGTVGHEIENDEVIQTHRGDQDQVSGPQVPLQGHGDEIENQNWVCREEVGTRAPVGVCRTRCCWCLEACNQRATHLLNCYNQKTLMKRNKYYVDSMMKF